MNQLLSKSFALGAITCLLTLNSIATEPPDLRKLAETGDLTLKKLQYAPAAWTVRCRLSEISDLEIKVLCHGPRQFWAFIQNVHGSGRDICRIMALDGVWYVVGKDQTVKYRPFEAELRLPYGYLFLVLSDIQCFSERSEFASPRFEKRDGNRLSFRVMVKEEARRWEEEANDALAKVDRFSESYLTFEQRRKREDALARQREQLNGIPMVVDEQTGILLERQIQSLSISIEEFHWLDNVPSNLFALPKGVRWEDQTTPWSAKDYEHCVMVVRDPMSMSEGGPFWPDAFVLNLKSGDMRRVPFVGTTGAPGGFIQGRRVAVVAGTDVNGRTGLRTVDLVTGKNEPLARDWLGGGPLMAGEISPDGKYALGFNPSGPEMEMEVRLVKLNDKSMRTIKADGLRGPASWLPEGDGIIVKRIEPRVLCRLNLDGTFKDLCPGDSPLVLRKSRRILYQENGSDLWHTCDLDGSNPKLYADGLPGHGRPAVSPDERRILFTRFNRGGAPQLMLFDFGKSDGVPVTRAPGYTGKPVWR